MALHQLGQRGQQALSVVHVQGERYRIKAVVIVVFFLIMVCAARIHHLFYRATHAQQQVHIQVVGLNPHRLHAGLRVAFDDAFYLGQRLF